ncbi:MAG: DUF3187 family protein [Myxococcaceae bacterium]
MSLPTLLLALAALGADEPRVSGLPLYEPLNPLEYTRSALFAPPLLRPRRTWAASVQLDYGSAVFIHTPRGRRFLLDAELGRVTLTGTVRLSSNLFVLISGGVQHASQGFLDGPLRLFHSALGITYRERERRPENAFGYVLGREGNVQAYLPVAVALRDTRLGVGWSISEEVQLLGTLVLPTAWADGYSARTTQFGLLGTWQRALTAWLVFQGTLGLGATPRTDAFCLLTNHQSVVFASASLGARTAVSRRNALYAHFFLHTPVYRNTGHHSLDNSDISLDFGWSFRTDDGWEFSAGLTEDLYPPGLALDVIFRFGVRYGF